MGAPKFLNKIGKKKWAELLKQLGDISTNEYDSLALLCASWQTYLAALDDVQEKGMTILSNQNGRTFVNPSVNVMNECWKQIVKLSKAFGLEPTKRESQQQPDEDDGWNELLDKGAGE